MGTDIQHTSAVFACIYDMHTYYDMKHACPLLLGRSFRVQIHHVSRRPCMNNNNTSRRHAANSPCMYEKIRAQDTAAAVSKSIILSNHHQTGRTDSHSAPGCLLLCSISKQDQLHNVYTDRSFNACVSDGPSKGGSYGSLQDMLKIMGFYYVLGTAAVVGGMFLSVYFYHLSCFMYPLRCLA